MILLSTLLVLAADPAVDGPGELLERAKQTVLVTNLRAVGVGDDVAAMVTIQVANALASRSKLRVLTVDEVNELVAHQKNLRALSCEDEACVLEMSRVANAQLALSGAIGRVGTELVINLHLVDAMKTASVGSGSRTVASVEAVAEILPGLLADVFGWEHAAASERYVLPSGAALSFAVFDLRPLGIDAEAADNLTQVLAVELKKVEGANVISRDDVSSLLELQVAKDRICEDETSCLAEVGGALGVDKLIVGHAGKIAESFVISLRMIDVREVRVDNRVTESFQGLEDQLIRAVRQAGRRLLGIDAPEEGSVAISGSQPETVVTLDNEEIGVLPLPPMDGLSPGRHSLRMSKDGYFDWRTDFYVAPGEMTALWGELQEVPAKWYQKWWVYAVAGAVIVGSVTTAILLRNDEAPPPYGELPEGEKAATWSGVWSW